MKRFMVMMLVLAMAFSLASCGSGNEDGDTVQRTDLIIGQSSEPDSLDGHNTLDANAVRVCANIYDALVLTTEKGEQVPSLAKDWEISPDGKLYTMYLEEGVTFHNGNPFNADAAKANFDRAMATPYQALQVAPIKEVRVVDEYTIEIELAYEFNLFPKNLSRILMVDTAVADQLGDEYGRNPVGTGAYKFVSWSTGSNVILEANEDYFKGEPPIKKLEFRIIPDSSTLLIALEKGEVDVAMDVAAIDVDTIKNNSGISYHEVLSNFVESLGFNVQKKPLDNVKVRQAIAYAVDKQAIVDVAFNGNAEVATCAVTPFQYGHADIEDYSRDVEKAKRLLKEAGYEKGFEVEVYAMEGFRKKASEVIQANLAEIGIKVDIVLLEMGTLLDREARGDHQLFVMESGEPYFDAYYMLLFQFDSEKHGAGGNFTFNVTPALDQKLKDVITIKDEGERLKIYEEMLQIVHDDVLQIPLFTRYSNLACTNKLKGAYAHPLGLTCFNRFSW